MANSLDKELFYTLDEEKRELVANGIQIGDGLKVIMQINKKYITGNIEDSNLLVNIDIGEISNISVSLQRKTSRDYRPGQRDASSFSRGPVMGNGRLIHPVLDRELINFIFKELHDNNAGMRMFELSERQDTFGSVFEVEEDTEQNITDNKEELVGGSDVVFSKRKEYIYLDDVPAFTLRIIGRASTVKNIVEVGDKDGLSEFKNGAIYQRVIKRVAFIGNSTQFDAVNPVPNEVIDFAIYGNDTGWKPLD